MNETAYDITRMIRQLILESAGISPEYLDPRPKAGVNHATAAIQHHWTTEEYTVLGEQINYRDANMYMARSGNGSIGWRSTLIELVEHVSQTIDNPKNVKIEWAAPDGGGGSIPLTDFAVKYKSHWRPKVMSVSAESKLPKGGIWVMERTDTNIRLKHGHSLITILKELASELRNAAEDSANWGLKHAEKELLLVYGLGPGGEYVRLENYEFLEQDDLWSWKTAAEMQAMIDEAVLIQNTKGF